MNKSVYIIIAILLLAGAGGTYFFFTNNDNKDTQEETKTTNETGNETSNDSEKDNKIGESADNQEDENTEPEETATYKITFKAEWSAETHPTNFPPNPHFSPFVALSHKEDFNLFEDGEPASEGIKDMAETGNTDALVAEIEDLAPTGNFYKYIVNQRLDSPGLTTGTIEVNQTHPSITVVSMIAPSPDWFISGTVNLFETGDWIDETTMTPMVWDAGTDSGKNYTSADLPTEPQGTIEIITEGPTTDAPMVGIMFERVEPA